MRKVLIVDDEADIRDILEFNFTNSGYETSIATSGEEAMATLKNSTFSLIVLDIMMGGMSGFDMAERIRKSGDITPIIFLTALDTQNDILRGFKAGGDDYVSKPFSIKELLARAGAIISRTGQSDILTVGEIVLDVTNKKVRVNGDAVVITKTEFLILHTLMKRPNKIYSRGELITKIWGGEVYVEERTVDVHIARLRKKLGAASAMIINRSGYGYCIES